MTAEPGSLREAVERSANAVMTGNFVQLMADITPEALAQLMQMAPSAGQLSLTQLPAITGYELSEIGPEGDGVVYHVTFQAAIGTATLSTTWKQILGQWKIAGAGVVAMDFAQPGAAPAPPPPGS